MATATDENVTLLTNEEKEEEEEEVVTSFSSEPVPKPIKISSPLPIPKIPKPGLRRHPLDVPYSVEDNSASVNIRIPERTSIHYARRPEPSKHSTRGRWACGISMIVLMLALTATAIALIITSKHIEEIIWWQKTVIYQVYPRSFQDSDGDGLGDLEGIRSRINYFNDIGIKAVWLNPIFESPQNDNGYDVSNYTAIYKYFGTMEQFKLLLNDLHDNGIHLLLDFVPNHTSDEHPWFEESKSNQTNLKQDWYIWANSSSYGGPPNNWISVFGRSAWTYVSTRKQWYLHQFSQFQPDLNYRNAEVKEAMKNVLRFWLEMGVDGFRVDAVEFLLEDPKLQNETRNSAFPSTQCITNITSSTCYDSQIHNLTKDFPGVHQICQEWKKIIDEYSIRYRSPRIFIGEVYDTLPKVMQFYGNNDNEFTFPFNFFLLNNRNWTGNTIACIVSQWLSNMPVGADANWVLGNHDEPRISSKVGLYLARVLNVLLLTLPGTPTTYYGEEILMTNVAIPANKVHDKYANRDTERTPMQWNTSNYAGFTFPNATPWLPLAHNYSEVNVEVESSSNISALQLYKQLLQLRSSKSAFTEGTYTCINATEDILVYLRHLTEEEDFKEVYLVVINFSNKNITTGVELSLSNTEIVISSYLNRTGKITLSSIHLTQCEALVIRGFETKGSCQKITQYEKNKCNFCDIPLS